MVWSQHLTNLQMLRDLFENNIKADFIVLSKN